MEFEIAGNPDYGELIVELAPGESVLSESGAMNNMSSTINMNVKLLGGVFSGIIRKFLGGESFFLGQYTAESAGHVAFSPRIPGTVLHRKMQGETWNLTAGSFLACTPEVDIKTVFGGLKAFFSGEGAFVLKCSGQGDLFYNAYGGVIEKQVQGSFTVDTGHVVAWEPSLDYCIRGMGGLKQTLFSGEGLVMNFTGTGKLLVQTRHLGGMVHWLRPFCRG